MRTAQVDNWQHDYATCRKNVRLRGANEVLIFDAELEKQQNFLTDSFAEIKQRKEQNWGNVGNPIEIEAETEDAEMELEKEHQLMEDGRNVFRQRLQAKEADEQA